MEVEKKENYFENNAGKNSTRSILETGNSPVKERQQIKANFTASKYVLNKKWAQVHQLWTHEQRVRTSRLWQQRANKQTAAKHRY